nr:hypothetical protein [Pleurocapsa sp. FMAR1]
MWAIASDVESVTMYSLGGLGFTGASISNALNDLRKSLEERSHRLA